MPGPAERPVTVRRDVLRLRGARLGPESPLPPLRPPRALPSPEVGPGVTPQMRERLRYGRLATPLPYPLQSGYDRDDHELELPSVVLDNGLVTATVLPGLGGRVWSLRDHAVGRELLHRPERLRFANFGLTDAWFAGGIEWNLGSTGHSCLSTRPVHAGVVTGPEGRDTLRLWEWERTRDLVLQVDLTLVGNRLLASTRVLNPDPEDKPLYYWTNIAVPETEGTRVLCRAERAWRTSYDGRLEPVAMPRPDGDLDVSRPRASRHAADYFYDVAESGARTLVAVEPDGRGFAQQSTSALEGRKLFLWGHGPGGRRWQEWLGGGAAGYCEVQAGRCGTQLEHDRLPGGAEISWTESFGALDLGAGDVAGDYARATEAAEAALSRVSPADALEDRHTSWRRTAADAPVVRLLATGSGWGAAELELRGLDDWHREALPFVEGTASRLLAAVRADDRDALDELGAAIPVPPVSGRWQRLLSIGGHWWTELGLAVAAEARGDDESAERHHRLSAAARPTAGALVGLAHAALRRGDTDTALAHLDRARSAAPDSRAVVGEQLGVLLGAGRPRDALAVLQQLPPPLRGHGRTRLFEAVALARSGDPAAARAIVDDLVVEDLAEGERVLEEVWEEIAPGQPVPARLDFRMVAGAEEVARG